MLMLQLSNWTVAKRKQVFRAILQALISKIGSFELKYLNPVLREAGSYYYLSPAVSLRSKTLDTFVAKVLEMDASDRFSPEKVYTIGHLNMEIISSTPATLKYLTVKSNMRLNLLKEIQNQAEPISAQKQFAVSDIEPEVLFDPYKAAV